MKDIEALGILSWLKMPAKVYHKAKIKINCHSEVNLFKNLK